jgi:hypothetical protein
MTMGWVMLVAVGGLVMISVVGASQQACRARKTILLKLTRQHADVLAAQDILQVQDRGLYTVRNPQWLRQSVSRPRPFRGDTRSELQSLHPELALVVFSEAAYNEFR